MTSHASLMVFLLVAVSGCGTAIKVTSVPYRPDTAERLRRGAHALGCRELASEFFDVFFVCPSHDDTIGINCSDGKVGLTCSDLWPRNCTHLFERINKAAAKKAPVETAK